MCRRQLCTTKRQEQKANSNQRRFRFGVLNTSPPIVACGQVCLRHKHSNSTFGCGEGLGKGELAVKVGEDELAGMGEFQLMLYSAIQKVWSNFN